MSDRREVEPGVWSVLDGTRSYEVRVAGSEVRVNGREVVIETADPREWNPQAARASVSGLVHVKAPMPGKVVRVLVSVSEAVTAGQGVAIVEAMKMQNELKSPRAGTVKAVAVTEGATVNAGAVIVTIE